MEKKLLVCDVEGTIFKAKYKISGTDYSSTMWQPLARALGDDAIREELDSNIEWDKPNHGKYNGNYLEWVNDTIAIHRKYGLTKDIFNTILDNAKYNDGVEDFFKNLDTNKYIPVFISGGFQELIEKAQAELLNKDGEKVIAHGFAACKYIWDKNGKLIAWNTQPSDFDDKYSFLKMMFKQYGLKENKDWIFVGDGKNDADIATKAPVSFAIGSSSQPPHVKLASIATYTIESFDEIMNILEKDEANYYLSKKRGLSSTQSILIGQRMMCSNDVQSCTVKSILTNSSTLKYYIKTNVVKSYKKEDNLFDSVIYTIEKSLNLYFNNDKDYGNFKLNFHKSSYTYNETSTINTRYYNEHNLEEWAIYINSPDFGTIFRQPIMGCNYEISALVQKINEKVYLDAWVKLNFPNNEAINKIKNQLEAFRPEFINNISKEYQLMTKVGDIPLGNNAEKKKIKQTDSVHSYINNSDRTEIITIITDDCEVNSQEIAKMLFTFSHVYVMEACELEKILNGFELKEKAVKPKIAVFAPNIHNVEDDIKYWNEEALKKPNDAIDYNTQENQSKIVSENEAIQYNLIDYVLLQYKKQIQKYIEEVENYTNRIDTKQENIEREKFKTKGFKEIVQNAVEYIEPLRNNIAALENKTVGILKNNKVCKDFSKYQGIYDLIRDGEISFRLFKNAVLNSGTYSTSILQPFCNAVEQCLRCAGVCLLTGDARTAYIQENENDRIMLGQQIGKYQKGELKNMLPDYVLINLEQANINRRNVSHNYIDKSMSELEAQKEIFYLVIKEITKILQKSEKI